MRNLAAEVACGAVKVRQQKFRNMADRNHRQVGLKAARAFEQRTSADQLRCTAQLVCGLACSTEIALQHMGPDLTDQLWELQIDHPEQLVPDLFVASTAGQTARAIKRRIDAKLLRNSATQALHQHFTRYRLAQIGNEAIGQQAFAVLGLGVGSDGHEGGVLVRVVPVLAKFDHHFVTSEPGHPYIEDNKVVAIVQRSVEGCDAVHRDVDDCTLVAQQLSQVVPIQVVIVGNQDPDILEAFIH